VKKILRAIQFFLLAGVLSCLPAHAQTDDSEAAVAPTIPADELNRGTPLRAGEGFMAAADGGDFEAAAEFLDLRNLRGQASELTGTQLARRLFVILSRASWVDVDELIDDPAGRSNDNLPDYRDSIGVIREGEKEIQLLMQKVPRSDGERIWKVSNATVSRIPDLYDTYGYPEAIEDLRRALPEGSFFGFELFKWVAALVAGALAYATVFLIALIIRRILSNSESPSRARVHRFLVLPTGIWFIGIATTSVGTWLGRGATAENIEQFSPVSSLLTVWVLFAGANLIRDIITDRLRKQNRPGAAVLLSPLSNAAKLLIAISATLIYMDKIGINITTVLAGLGVGGVAVALALQKPMEDVFGAITLYAQQPVRVGDFCRVGKVTGTIEEIGLRTTRIRTLANTVIAVPNSRLANEPIDNISARQKIRFLANLRLRYDTTPDQLQQLLAGIRELLTSYERVSSEGHRVRFTEIADDGLLIEVIAHLDTTDWAEYLELAEYLNIHILDIVSKAGTALSLPARAIHIERTEEI
jgi:MscS family membrane protein